MWVPSAPVLTPVHADGINSELGGVIAATHRNEPGIACEIVNPTGNGDALGIGREIMVVDLDRRGAPLSSGLIKTTDQLSCFGVDADRRPLVARKSCALLLEISELAVPQRWCGWIVQARCNALEIDAEPIAKFFEDVVATVVGQITMPSVWSSSAMARVVV